MSRVVSSSITLAEVFNGADGTVADVYNWIFKDAATQPTTPLDSTGVPAGWLNDTPSSVADKLWSSLGVQTSGAGDFVWGNPIQMTGLDGVIGSDGLNAGLLVVYADDAAGTNKTITYVAQEFVLYYEYSGVTPAVSTVTGTWVRFVGADGAPGAPGAPGTPGTPGVDGTVGTRGPGRFEKSISRAGTAPLVGSATYNVDALALIASVLGGGINPVAGDIVIITYTNTTPTPDEVATRGAIHDGTGVDDLDWTSFALQIDGSLLVNGTVVGDSFDATSKICVGSNSTEGACLDGRDASSQGLSTARRIYAGSKTANDNTNIKFSVEEDGSVMIGSHTGSGARIEVTDQSIKVYDASGTERVVIGNLL